MILSIENLTKAYGEKMLFEDISFGIETGDKIGIVGVNGVGKSTFLKAVAELTPVDNGALIKMRGLRIEYLRQECEIEQDQTVLAEVFRGTQPVMEALRAYELALAENRKMPEDAKTQAKILRLSQQIDALDGWQIESDAKAVLTQLGLDDFSARAGDLSGGQRKRLALAAALTQPCDLLILDEPTNHLDSETIVWLEGYLRKFKGALLLVTHDRYFLDAVATRILELDRGKAYTYAGNYSEFLTLKAQRLEREEAGERKRQNLLRTELAWMRRGAQARSTKQKARIERFETLKNQSAPPAQKQLEIGLGGTRLGRTVIELEHVSYAAPDRQLIRDFNYVVLRNDRIGILGKNGVGKSTLLNLLAGRLSPTGGTVKIGQTVKIGYFAQENIAMDERLRAIEYIREASQFITLADGARISASQLMEMFLFPGDLQWTPISRLSGGEKRRLFLLRILMEEPNVLLLDEPTNDLDLQTMAVLEDFIDHFSGAVLIVSHDRFFVDRLVDKVFVYEESGALTQYPGGYSDYKAAVEKEAEAAPSAKLPKEKTVREKPSAEKKRKLSFKERREYEEIEAVIASLEGELKAVRLQMAQAGADYGLLSELSAEAERLEGDLNQRLERWTYLEEIAAEEEK